MGVGLMTQKVRELLNLAIFISGHPKKNMDCCHRPYHICLIVTAFICSLVLAVSFAKVNVDGTHNTVDKYSSNLDQ